MTVHAFFSHGRCYFRPFNEKNDINPKTNRSGINYFYFDFIGFLLSKVGLAIKVHCKDDNAKEGNVYLHRFSFFQWHRWNDCPETYLDIKNKNYEQAIIKVCNQFFWSQINLEQKDAFSTTRMSLDTENHPYKDEICAEIKNLLIVYKKTGSIQLDGRARQFESEEEREKQEEIKKQVARFFENPLFKDAPIYVAE